MQATKGTLTVKPSMAELKTDKNYIFKADPYCVFYFGTQKKTSQPCKKGGTHPMWDETFMFERETEDTLKVQIWDKEWILSDDFIAEGEVSMVTLLKAGTQTVWLDMYDKGNFVGKLLLETEYSPYGKVMSESSEISVETVIYAESKF